MRKYWLSISLLPVFLLCFTGSNGQGAHASAPQQGKDASVLAAHCAHSEIEIPHSFISAGNPIRTQSPHNLIDPGPAAAQVIGEVHHVDGEPLPVCPFKQYLFHIYPSHNFW